MAGVSVFEIVHFCYKIGQEIVDICNTWASADEEVQSRTVIVQSSWDRSRRQVDFIQRIAPILDPGLFQSLDDLLNQLFLRLSAASNQIESVIKRELSRKNAVLAFRVRKAVYIWKKEALDAIIRDLEEWQRRFDPSWFLIMTIANPIVDRELEKARATAGQAETGLRGPPNASRSPLAAASGIRAVLKPGGSALQRSVFLPESEMDVLPLRYSDARLARLRTADMKWYVMDTIFCHPSADVKALTRDVRSLATKLSQADPIAFGLLNCKGVMRVTDTSEAVSSHGGQITAFNIVFRVPEGMDSLLSLRDLILMHGNQISLTQKIRIACELTKSISYVHTFDFVHKNVRPESILCFNDLHKRRSHTFLVGFDAFRAADGNTMLHGDTMWERNLYRHPLRQGPYPLEKYRMQHDIYSLGVCLLEIGLWESFVEYNENGQAAAGQWWTHFQFWLGTANVASHDFPHKVKDYFVDLARNALPARLGDKYSTVVLACLTCLDDDSHFASGETEEGSMAIAVRFIEQTVSLLGEISV